MRSKLCLFLTACFIASLTVAGCQAVEQASDGAAETQPADSELQTDPVIEIERYTGIDPTGQTVVFWHPYTQPQQETLQTLVDGFNRNNPFDITVEETYQGSYQDVFSRVYDVANSQDVPDMVIAYQNHAANLFQQGALVDLTPLVNSPEWGMSAAERTDYYSAAFDQDVFSVFSDTRLGLPVSRSAEVLYVNREWLAELGFNKPPESPEEFQEMACAASEVSFTRAVLTGVTGYELTPDASRFTSWAFAFGADLFDEETNTFTLNSKPAVESMQFLQGLVHLGCAALSNGRTSDREAFGSGTVLFTSGSSSGYSAIAQAVSDSADFTWTVAPLPHTAGQPVTNLYGASLSILRSSPERELAAWQFVRYLSRPETQAVWAEATGTIPVRASANEILIETAEGNKSYRSMIQSGSVSRTEPSVPGYDAVRLEMENAMAAIMAGADAQITLDVLNETANEILAQSLSAGTIE